MATCTRCGRTISIRQRDLLSGFCPECKRTPITDSHEIIKTFERRRSQHSILAMTAIASLFLGGAIDLARLANRPPSPDPDIRWQKPSPDSALELVVSRPTAPDEFFPFFIIASIPVVLVLGIASDSVWYCPACNKFLGYTWNPEFCFRCGVRLRNP